MGAYLSEPIKEKEVESGENEILKYCVAAMQGWRTEMEDAHVAALGINGEKNTSMFGVFDGHGGKEVALFVSKYIVKVFKETDEFKNGKIHDALRKTYFKLDTMMLSDKYKNELIDLGGSSIEDAGQGLEHFSELGDLPDFLRDAILSAQEEISLDEELNGLGNSEGRTCNDTEKQEVVMDIDVNVNSEAISPKIKDIEEKQELDSNSHKQEVINIMTTEGLKSYPLNFDDLSSISSTEDSDSVTSSDCVRDSVDGQDLNEKSTFELNYSQECEMEEKRDNSEVKLINEDSSNFTAEDDIIWQHQQDDAKSESTTKSKSIDITASPASLVALHCQTQNNTIKAKEDQDAIINYFGNNKKDNNEEVEEENENKKINSLIEDSAAATHESGLDNENSYCNKIYDDNNKDNNEMDIKLNKGENGKKDEELIVMTPPIGYKPGQKNRASTNNSNSFSFCRFFNFIFPFNCLESMTTSSLATSNSQLKPDFNTTYPNSNDALRSIITTPLNNEIEEEIAASIPSISNVRNEERKDEEYEGPSAGCTAIVAAICGKKLYVANAGDSRCVLSRTGKAVPLSRDHKPTDAPEELRIKRAGGYVSEGRVNGSLNLSRALGDMEYKQSKDLPPEKQIVTADPDIVELDLHPDDEFLILACDGIWDVLSEQEAVDYISSRMRIGVTLKDICESMCDHCLAEDTEGSGEGCDNMTVMIVSLKFLQCQSSPRGDTNDHNSRYL